MLNTILIWLVVRCVSTFTFDKCESSACSNQIQGCRCKSGDALRYGLSRILLFETRARTSVLPRAMLVLLFFWIRDEHDLKAWHVEMQAGFSGSINSISYDSARYIVCAIC